ncbi:hypothetical protein [Prochlorococcus sp. MIT 1300]|uniref:hypothetical protein n=1 Tax=Prochlorococcus sp. MIT 1300 TaxID=3096218 RepID=UPI002A752A34|nr:hypothetical protein [Prochlorococcus sp. MIT 1300]
MQSSQTNKSLIRQGTAVLLATLPLCSCSQISGLLSHSPNDPSDPSRDTSVPEPSSSRKAQMLEKEQEKKVAEVGIETADSETLDNLNLQRTVYVGQCPGVRNHKTDGYFVDYSISTQPGYKVKLVNYARGLSPQKPPFTDRSYDRGRASDQISFKLANKHKKSYLAVREGLNPIKYQIVDSDNVVQSSGTFMLTTKVIVTQQRRDKEYNSYSREYYCPWF